MSRSKAYAWLSKKLQIPPEQCHIGMFNIEQCKATIKLVKGDFQMAQSATAKSEAPSTKVVTGKVRFSYLNVFQPRAVTEGQDPRYSVCLLIPKTDKQTLGSIKLAMEAARQNSAALFGGKVPAQLKSPIHDGDGQMPNGGDYGDECAGHWVLNAASKQKPGIVDANCSPILDSTEIYSGCYGRASINFFAYNQAGNRGIGCGLNNIQKLTDGDALGGGRSKPEDDFGGGAFLDNDENPFD
jgi:hypothetical protein